MMIPTDTFPGVCVLVAVLFGLAGVFLRILLAVQDGNAKARRREDRNHLR